MYDLIIIGAGPAGITAAIYAARKKMDLLVITRDIGGQTNWTLNVENYTGYQIVTGIELVKRFREHLNQFNINVKENEIVKLVEKNNKLINVVTNKETYQSKTLIIASGRKPRKLGVAGEDRLRNKGLAYCATCDAPLFSDVNVAVIGGGNSALDAVIQLSKIAKKVYVIDTAKDLRADPVMIEKAKESGKVIMLSNTSVKEILGDNFVSGIKIERDGKMEELAVEGVFVEIGSLPASEFARDLMKNRDGEILVNCRTETSSPGIFAAGDVTDVPAKQIIVACGEGAKAALSAFDYFNKHP